MRETRPMVLAHHINLATHAGITFRVYAMQVRNVYNLRTPAPQRAIRFHETRDIYSDEKLNAQILRRLLDDLDDLPSAIEEALVLALPEPFQGECRRELAQRMGQLAAAIPAGEHGAAVADAAALMRETGEVLTELAQSFDGNSVLPHKRPVAQRALGNLADVEAVVETIKTRLAAALETSVVQPLQKRA